MTIKTIDSDLAKEIFWIHDIDTHGRGWLG